MSSRAVKQRLRGRAAEELEEFEESLHKSDEEEEVDDTPASSSVNAFSLLAADDDGGDDADEEEPEEKPQKSKNNQNQQPKNTKSRRRKNRKKPKKQDEDIDAIMRELNLKESKGKEKEKGKGEKEKPSASMKGKEPLGLLDLSPEFLSADAELKRLFGAKTIASQRKEASATGKRGQNVRKKMLLVAHKPSWPPVDSGITMDLTETKKGVSYFNMIWAEPYKKLQEQYFSCVETMDPDRIAELLQFHPYHLDSLLQLADVCKQSSEHETAIDLVERAILRFEHCWHPLFYQAILKGVGRLEYSNEQNRPFHLAIFRYIHMLGRRGCVRTALEYCKLLLTMDPTDPFGILLLFDHYCIRAKEFEYLLVFTKEGNYWHEVTLAENDKKGPDVASWPPLLDLPNFAYSVALAKYCMETADKEKVKEGVSSNSLLQDALIAFPMILAPLVGKCGVRMSQKESGCPLTWEEICKHRHFSTTYDSNMKHVVPLFVDFNYPFWKPNEVALWLKINAWETIKRVDAHDPAVEKLANKRHDGYFSKQNVYNHVLLSDITEAISYLPGQARIFRLYDEMAPRRNDSVNAFTSNPLALFLSTLLPWAQVPDAPPVGAEGQPAQQGQQQPVGTEWLLANLLPMLGGRGGGAGGDNNNEENEREGDD